MDNLFTTSTNAAASSCVALSVAGVVFNQPLLAAVGASVLAVLCALVVAAFAVLLPSHVDRRDLKNERMEIENEWRRKQLKATARPHHSAGQDDA